MRARIFYLEPRETGGWSSKVSQRHLSFAERIFRQTNAPEMANRSEGMAIVQNISLAQIRRGRKSQTCQCSLRTVPM
jgi:hypothetical protein